MKAILFDLTKCTGCEKCVAGCIESNGLNAHKADYDRAVSKDGLSSNRFLSLIEVQNGKYARKSCMHCVEPSCVAACLVGGLTKTKEGPVVYDPDKCIGCRYCMLSCPFEIPRYEWDKTSPYIKKCDMCFERLSHGQKPACVQSCPNNAIIFGERDQLLKLAHNRIKTERNKYIDHVWGEKEFGGTSIIYISDVSLDQLGFTKHAKESIPEMTEPVVEATPIIAASVATGLIGLNWIVNRRNKLKKEQSNKSEESGGR
jgi:formate dehydrogenase iron-sulfur subunit